MEILGISLDNILIWSGLGLIIGILASLIDFGDVKGGLLGSVIAGVLGALAGGFLAVLIFELPLAELSLQNLLIPIGGALILVLIERLLFRDRGHIKTDIERKE